MNINCYDCKAKLKRGVVHELSVQEIWIYPVKSLGGYRSPEALVLEKGFAYDRRWMLVDENNRFLTQREHPEMAWFTATCVDGCLHIRHRKNNTSTAFDISLKSQGTFPARIWNDTVLVTEVDHEVSRWFTLELGLRCKLVFFSEESPRPADRRYVTEEKNVSLADAFPYLIIGQSSLNALNLILPEPVSMLRFRPNLVVAGSEPFAEDTWKKLTIGPVPFEMVKPCARCVLTTVNPENAQRGREPLATLATFRKKDNAIYFGMNAIATSRGLIKENDAIILH